MGMPQRRGEPRERLQVSGIFSPSENNPAQNFSTTKIQKKFKKISENLTGLFPAKKNPGIAFARIFHSLFT
jgi:hypothetical protein